MTTEATSPSAPRRRVRRALVYVAWTLVIVALLVLVAVGLAAISVAGEARPAHGVLDVQLTTTSSIPPTPAQRDVYELWSDDTLGRVRLSLRAARQTLYYQRDGGAWYIFAQHAPGGAWSEVRLSRQQQPAALSEDGVRRLFAALQRRAAPRTVTRVGLRGHIATAFLSNSVTWPFPAVGPTTVWLDGVTGLPVQFRTVIVSGSGGSRGVFITAVDRLTTIRSTTLPYNFFTPPAAQSSPWDRFVGIVRGWLHHS